MGMAAVVAGIVVLSAVAGHADDSKAAPTPKPTPNAAPSAPGKTEGDSNPMPELKTELDKFKWCVNSHGIAGEKAAVKHVIKVQLIDHTVADQGKVYTNYSGGMFGGDGSNSELLISAFADCYSSDNGLVTVYDKDGHVMGVGNY